MPEVAAPVPAAQPAPVQGRFELPPEEPTSKEVEAPQAPVAAKEEPAANTTESAPVAEPEAKPEPEVTAEQQAKREQRRAQNKLEKAFRLRAEALARAEFLEKRLAEVEKAAQPKAAEGEPKLEQFDYDPEKYAAAKAEYAKSQAAKEFEARQREQSTKAEQQRLVAEWDNKVEAALDKYDDFNEVVGVLNPEVPVIAAIMEAENAADVAYYLGKHPKEAQRIAALPMRSQIREIGKLEVKLLSEPKKPQAPSKAPAPITPLSGTAPVATDVPSENDDMSVWIRKRQKQVYGKR